MDRSLRYFTARAGGLLAAALVAGCHTEHTVSPLIVRIEVVSGQGQSGYVGASLAEPLVVRALDETNSPVEGATIAWRVAAGGGTVNPSESITDSDGLASSSFRLGISLGQQTAQATVGTGSPVAFGATATAAPPHALTVTSGSNQTGAVASMLPQEIAVKVTDAYGYAVSGASVAFAVAIGGGSINAPNAVSDAAGLVKFRWTLGTLAGLQAVAVATFGVNTMLITATARPGPAARVVVVSGNGQSAPPGAALPEPLVAKVTDQYDNAISDVTVTWTPVGANAGSVNPITSRTSLDGRAATQWTIGPTSGPKEVRATASGSSGSATFEGAGEITFSTVIGGGFHSCGYDQNGGAYCWGLFGEGQLGMGSAPAGSPAFFPFPKSVVPESNSYLMAEGTASNGTSHSCAIVTSLDAYCWGKNGDGRLGTGGSSNATTPQRVAGTGFAALSAGGSHTCGLTTADKVFCWGLNTDGQAGGSGSTFTPVAVMSGENFGSVAAGGQHSCAVATNGKAYCWGNNGSGQLGSAGAGGAVPAQVSGGLLFASVTAGDSHTCALTADGTAYCWGKNSTGQLGDGTFSSSTTPVHAASGFSFVVLVAGLDHTCGLTAAGLAYCWGLNSSGELGNASTNSSPTPVPVGGGHAFQTISTGARHTCGVTSSGVAYCWGSNQVGQLGDGGQMTVQTLPSKVAYQR